MCYHDGMDDRDRRAYHREWTARKSAANKALGLCRCGREPSEGRKVCDRCLSNNNRSKRKTRSEYAAAGLCQCGAKPREGLKTCERCGRDSLLSRKRKVLVERLAGGPRGECVACGVTLVVRQLEADHIKPRAHGGKDGIANRQLLCRTCNQIKNDRSMEYLLGYIERERVDKERWGMRACSACGELNTARNLRDSKCAPCISTAVNTGVQRRLTPSAERG